MHAFAQLGMGCSTELHIVRFSCSRGLVDGKLGDRRDALEQEICPREEERVKEDVRASLASHEGGAAPRGTLG